MQFFVKTLVTRIDEMVFLLLEKEASDLYQVKKNN